MSAPVEEELAGLSVSMVPENPLSEADRQDGKCPSAADKGAECEFDETVCAICLNKTPVADSAQPDCCEHTYCACCILHWAVYKEKAWCPQCKAPFSSLLTYRTLDGRLRDYPSRESVCLLKCTGWFQDHVKMRERLIAESGCTRSSLHEGSVIDDSDYVDYARYYDEYDDDEEVENYYFSAAAGRARVVLGNRRHGPNGFISSGRMQARPAAPPPQTKGKNSKSSESSLAGSRSAEASQAPDVSKARRSGAGASQKREAKGKAVAGDAEDVADCKPGKQSAGRRARRNQRKAAADARAGF